MPLEMRNTNEANYFANHYATPPIMLHCLAQHPDLKVRLAVAENKNTLPITAKLLAQDDNPELRYALAENQQTDWGILNILAADKNPMVADRAQKTLSDLKQAMSGVDLLNISSRSNFLDIFDS